VRSLEVAWLAEALIERDRLSEAEALLTPDELARHNHS
jgi:hypothetical protein